jgi:hypothetical protein
MIPHLHPVLVEQLFVPVRRIVREIEITDKRQFPLLGEPLKPRIFDFYGFSHSIIPYLIHINNMNPKKAW